MNVLILTGKFGMGHIAVAQALKEEIMEKYPTANIACSDIFEYTMPEYAESIYKTFALVAKSGNSFYNLIYKQTDHKNVNDTSFWCRFFKKKLQNLFLETQPDVIISTLPLCSRLVSWYKEEVGASFTLVTCITDISSHEEWIHKNTNYYLVGSKLVKRMLLLKGVYEEKIFVTGIPVRKAFHRITDDFDGKKVNKKLGQKASKHLLVMGGGLGLLPRTKEFYEGLNSLNGVRTTVITGNNKKLYNLINGRYENVEAVSYTKNVAMYMNDADVIMTKPGGISIFEALFCEKPLLLFRPFLQQEVNNMRFVLRNHVGTVISGKEEECLALIKKTMQDETNLERMKANIKTLKEQFNQNAVEYILKRVEQGIRSKDPIRKGDWVS
ncbi:MGDG synthase family glycosyltransferase [Anaerovorax sp. IOR16]|uniref:MGDG synthase family glycosyltransferase n=1 Tax=Anaerovorax sp. IOR16 TaxID=2773458 RepID=UPI0019CF7C60|nr:glycosyltransferase [Anaerovorax sp. IOR16]